MSYFKKYAIILITLVFMVNVAPISCACAQSLDGQLQELQEKIAKKKKALAKLVKEAAVGSISFENPMEALKDLEEQLLLDENTPETVKKINDIKESRYEMRRGAIYQSFILGAKSKLDKSSFQKEIKRLAEGLKTMPGESERSGVQTEVLLTEMVVIMNYIRTELVNLNREAAIAAADIKHVKSAGSIEETFNMCKYYTKRRKEQSFMEQVSGIVNETQNTMTQVSGGIVAVNDFKDSTQAMVNEAQSSIPLKPEDLAKEGMIR